MTADLDFFLNRPAFARRAGSEKPWWQGWNGLESQEVDPNAPLEEWMQVSGTNWEVALKDLYYLNASPWLPNEYETSKLGKVLMRTDRMEPLAHVGPQYTPIQNKEMFRFIREYLDSGIATIETIGSLRGGREVFALAKVKNGEFTLPGGDEIKNYLLVVASHGGGANYVRNVYTRVVCSNTLAMALAEKQRGVSFKITHRSEWTEEKELNAKLDAGITSAQMALRKLQMTKLATTEVSDSWAQDYFKQLLGKPTKSIDEQPKAVFNTMDLFSGKGIGSALPSARNTAWGAVNAVTEWVDHHRGKEESRQFHALLGNGAALKQTAYNTALDLIHA